jgi:hypothetical protein
MQSIPLEIEDIIWTMYWKEIYTNKILNELMLPNILDLKINTFVNRYCLLSARLFDDIFVHYLKKLNNDIRMLVQSKPVSYLFCKNSDLCLQFCYGSLSNVDSIVSTLKYIWMYSLSCCRIHRFYVFKRFQYLSTNA